ncbi:M48 family metallopeptidase [Agrilutibacter solisilvae]|uniref:M48 family metalloprotease n=1 Tax=Agrilutibacter solisilvae TaxID=2763317 RepID=A0A975ATZ2_9GAMM|nr:M48 family metallopeptidase [Lysobacter solisilvae]QSX79883.1 M48 family metalloprotease [Lysobacter solisilvae]
MVRKLSLALSLFFAGTAGAAPPLAHLQPGQRPAPGTTEAELWYGMDQAEKQIRQSPYVVRDASLQAYVEDVVCKVAGPHCKEMRVYIVDVPVFNASMAPNGATLLFTGALLRMRDESELAVVLGHEFAHYKARHSLEGWNSAKRTSAFLNTFGLVTLTFGVPIAGELAALGGIGTLFKQSRDNEREADALGFATAVAQGYDPQAGVRVWERLRREEQADRTHRNRVVFASHPQSEERIADIRAAAAAIPASGTAITHLAEYRAAMAPFQEKWMAGELSRRTYDMTVQVFTELEADAAPEYKGLYTYYLGEAHRRRNHKDDAARAATLFARATTQPGAPPAAWREHGMQLREKGQTAAAVVSLRRYLTLAPQADDAAVVQHYVTRMESPR